MFPAVLDTCVLWPSLQRDLLLSLAIEGLYRPLWQDRILAELEEAETAKLVQRGRSPADAAALAARLVEHMTAAFPGAIVPGWELYAGRGLPDPDDEHVVAAAVVGHAGQIVTHNHRDFPAECLPEGIEAVDPRDFALEAAENSLSAARRAVEQIARRRSAPGMTVDEVVDALALRYGMDGFADLVRTR